MTNLIIIVLLLVIGLMLGLYLGEKRHRKETPSVSMSFIQSKLSDCSDLTTCRLEYAGMVKYSDGSIPLISKKSFSMIYKADVRAGIDLSQADVHIDGQTVRVTLPPAEIQSIDVDHSSLKFYDERSALFNWDRKEDISIAVKAAMDDVEKNAGLEGLLVQAHNQAEMVIYKLIEPAIGEGYHLVIDDIVAKNSDEELPLDILSHHQDELQVMQKK